MLTLRLDEFELTADSLRAPTDAKVAFFQVHVFPAESECLSHRFHPDIGFRAAQQLVTTRSYVGVVAGLARAWPTMTKATEEANANLCFDLSALAEAEEHFIRQGHHNAGSLRDSVQGKPSLSAARKIFPTD